MNNNPPVDDGDAVRCGGVEIKPISRNSSCQRERETRSSSGCKEEEGGAVAEESIGGILNLSIAINKPIDNSSELGPVTRPATAMSICRAAERVRMPIKPRRTILTHVALGIDTHSPRALQIILYSN